ncbi:SDR family NAD(P)-dependent oxidoreductase [Pedobacter sp. B4-66]|uniref:SDR family NAD(P)-dependent oxidoreductase n=1 Tax=Pedobacter sp. B4-66 TaxID=2817280 RepID=UPI001BD97223|nr:SDR family NAD(P)-dependent oxidoreductase [Pedobacter sp. B4-66]
MKSTRYTLITGASSGLGKEFSVQCAAMGRNIIMVALPGSNMASIAESLALEYKIDARVFEFDITDGILLIEKLNHIIENFEVDFLINNAGIGGTASITESSLEAMDRILQVNIRSMVSITQMLLPHLLKHQKSYILNVSSMAAFTPIAYKTVYPASKAFISSFSLGLREELLDTNLSVSVVYPGPIMTNSGVSTRIMGQGAKGRIGLLTTSEIVRIALKQTKHNKAIIIPGFWNKINHRLMGILPLETKLRIVSRAVKKEIAIK